MTITVENESGTEFPFDIEGLAEQVINGVLDEEAFPFEAEVNVLLVTKEEIQAINLRQREIDAVTDVLSFPMAEYDAPADFDALDEEDPSLFDPDTGELLLGDIVLNQDRIESQAREYGHEEKRELAFLVAHSMLHLFGYDHMEDGERLEMEKRQEEILTGKGYRR